MNEIVLPKDNSGWYRAAKLAAVILLLCYGYEYLATGSITGSSITRIWADTAILLIGYSITVTSLSQFLARPLNDSSYRKELGQIGFLFACTHLATTIFLSTLTWEQALEPYTVVAGIFSILSFGIFLTMSLVSFKPIKEWLGMELWLKIIKLGLWAFGLGLVHGLLKGALHIVDWKPTENIFPPLSLFILICALSMFFIHHYYRYQKAKLAR